MIVWDLHLVIRCAPISHISFFFLFMFLCFFIHFVFLFFIFSLFSLFLLPISTPIDTSLFKGHWFPLISSELQLLFCLPYTTCHFIPSFLSLLQWK